MQLSGQTLIAASPAESVSASEVVSPSSHSLHPFSSLTSHQQLKLGNTLLMMSHAAAAAAVAAKQQQSFPPATPSPPSARLNGGGGGSKCDSPPTTMGEEKKLREVNSSSPISVSARSDSNRSMSPFSPGAGAKSKEDEEDEQMISVSSPLKPHAALFSAAAAAGYHAMPNPFSKAYHHGYAPQHQAGPLPGQFPYPFGFPFAAYSQQYDLSFASSILNSHNQPNSSGSGNSPNSSIKKPSTNFSVASLLAGKEESAGSKSKKISNNSYSEGEEEDDDDIDEELMEESAAAAVAAAAAADDEDDEAVDMSNHDDDRKISVTRLTPSPSPHQLSPPNSRSVSPLSPNYFKMNGEKNQQMLQQQQHLKSSMSHPMGVDQMSAAIHLQIAAAAAARHRFHGEGMMKNMSPGQGLPPSLFGGSHGPHAPHPLLSSLHGGTGQQQQPPPPGWLPHHGSAHPSLDAHPLNAFHWLSQSAGPLSPSQSKCPP